MQWLRKYLGQYIKEAHKRDASFYSSSPVCTPVISDTDSGAASRGGVSVRAV